MSLFKQIASIMTFFIIVVMSFVLWINFSSNKQFIQEQLFANSIDTANSLGLSIQNSGNLEDIAMIEGMITSVFDNGFFEKIELVDIDENIIVQKELTNREANIPKWFYRLVGNDFNYAKASISNGWVQFGELRVTSDRVHAQTQMWKSFQSLVKLFAVVTIVLLVFLYMILKILLKPLVSLDNQAKAVENNEFLIADNLPSTLEFRNVVSAMNFVVKKLEKIFHKEAKTLAKYNELLYKDPDTKLGNRNYFDLQINAYLNAKNSLSIGTVWMMEFDGYETLKKNIGFGKTNNLIKTLMNEVTSLFDGYEDLLLCRISSGTFILVLPSSNIEESYKEAVEINKKLFQKSKELEISEESGFLFAIALAKYNQKTSIRDILTKTDYALARAKQKDENFVELYEDEFEQALTKEEWIETIHSVFKNESLLLFNNPIIKKDEVFAEEFFPVIEDKNKTKYISGEYLPIVKSLGWLKKFEQFIIESIGFTCKAKVLIIPLTTDLLDDRPFVKWLKEWMKKEFNKTIYFQFSDISARKKQTSLVEFHKLLKLSGHKIGIDEFSIQNIDTEYLKALSPAYIKIQREYLFGKNAQAEIIGGTLSNIASSIGSKIVVKNLEKSDDINFLENLGIKYYQYKKENV